MKTFTDKTRIRVIRLYTLLFYILALHKWIQGGWLFQYNPFTFRTRFDGFTWLFMQTRAHTFLLDHPRYFLLADLLFYGIPIILLLIQGRSKKWSIAVAWLMVIINWTYVQLYTLYPTNSIEAHVAWLLMPILFLFQDLRSFYLVLHGLGYYFLFVFLSAGLWKIYGGGVFHYAQMSNILLGQHRMELVSSPFSVYSRFIRWLIANKAVSFSVLWAGLACQLSFLAGFFTKRFDRLLVVVFIIFLVMDQVVMKIDYTDLLPLAIPLWYRSYTYSEGTASSGAGKTGIM